MMRRPHSQSCPFSRIADLQDERLEQHPEILQHVKQRTLSNLSSRSRYLPHNRTLLAWVAMTVLGGLGLMMFLTGSFGTPDDAPSSPSQWIVSSATHSETLVFADQSRVILSANSSARVLETTPQKVRILLEKGRATVRVVPGRWVEWLLEAGPYTVAVTGTRFTLTWDSRTQYFSLDLQQGSVSVTGPMIEEGKTVEAGQRVAAWVTERRFELSKAVDAVHRSVPDIVGSPETETKDADVDADIDGGAVTSRNSKKPKNTIAPRPGSAAANTQALLSDSKDTSWQQLCQDGKFNDVVQRATQSGLHQAMETASRVELMALGEAARLTRNRIVSNDVYQSVRRRFPGSTDATQAAFYLGKIAFDQHRAYGIAVQWLTIYLKEAPNGRFAQEALGKLMEAQYTRGSRTAAKDTAKTYLKRYPAGTHASMADDILDTR